MTFISLKRRSFFLVFGASSLSSDASEVTDLFELSSLSWVPKVNTALTSLPAKSSLFPPSTPIHSLPILSSYKITANLEFSLAASNDCLFFLSSSPWIRIFSHFTFSSLKVVTIDLAFPPLFLSFKFEAKVTTTFVSIRKQVYSKSSSLTGNLTVKVPIAI